jgi:hypothetical protein
MTLAVSGVVLPSLWGYWHFPHREGEVDLF